MLIFKPQQWAFWFLRELFITYCIVYICYKTGKKWYTAFTLSLCIVFITPYFGMQKPYLPLFLAGILLKGNYQHIVKHISKIAVLSGLLFAACLFLRNGEYALASPIISSLFPLLTAFSGSVFFFSLFRILYRDNLFFSTLSKIGRYTLAIYILQLYILEIKLNALLDFQGMNIWIYNFIVTPLVAAAVIVFIMLIIKILRKNKSINLFAFGGSLSARLP
jgi:hypothetical protein